MSTRAPPTAWITVTTVSTLAVAALVIISWQRRRRRIRPPFRCGTTRCEEHFLNARASRLPLHQSLAQGHSILLLHRLASGSEASSLSSRASKVAAEANAFKPTDPSRPWWSVPEAPGRMRLPLEKAFDVDAQAVVDRLLIRSVNSVRDVAPALLQQFFGDRLMQAASLTTVVHHPGLSFSPREPAINVYSSRGRFKPHKDHELLTVLVPLNDGFEGGGTAFWSPESVDQSRPAKMKDEAALAEPSLVLRPSPGSTIIFAGSITHAAVDVLAGERCCLVASFSPTPSDESSEES